MGSALLCTHKWLLKTFEADLKDEIPVLLGLKEGMFVGDRVADDEPFAASHVLFPHRRELHLPGRVQDVQQARLTVDHCPLKLHLRVKPLLKHEFVAVLMDF